MKTYFIFLCVIVGCGLAKATTNTSASQDKPDRLYVESYTDNETSESIEQQIYFDDNGNPTTDPWGFGYYWWNDDSTASYTVNWSDGSTGNAYWKVHDIFTSNVTNTTSDAWSKTYWPPGSWPNIPSGMVTDWTGDTDSAGSPVILEHCDLGVPLVDETGSYLYPPPGSYRETVIDFGKRHAQAKMTLQTGGRSSSKLQNLFGFNGTATRILPSKLPPPFNGFNNPPPVPPIPRDTISINNVGFLPATGAKYKVLPDNATLDVTPTVAGVDYFTFDENEQKYTFTLTASTNGTAVDLSTNTPEFCVGQQVTLQATWNPALPSGIQVSYEWDTDPDFVNSSLPTVTTDGSPYPYIDPTLMTNSTTSLWWYGWELQMPKLVYCSIATQFPNGQTATLTGKGKVSIYRPSVKFVAGSPAIPMLTNSFLELGDLNTAAGLMTFAAQVTSKTSFQGTANWTQLINRAVNGVSLAATTDGQYWLDNSQFYNDGVGDDPAPTIVNPEKTVSFSDNPGVSGLSGDVSISDGFQTYLVFKPDGDNSIWVTLGIVTWSWSAVETYWTLTSSHVGGASYIASDAFPQWLHTIHNSGKP